MRIPGKTAIVTGGGSGIGRAVAIRLAFEGANVVVADIDETSAEKTRLIIEDKRGEALAIGGDVSNDADARRVVEATLERYKAIHILVNNAAVFAMGGLTEFCIDDWDRTMAVNVRGMALMARYAAPRMGEAGGGSIINIASISAFIATPGMVAYGASKAAVLGLTKNMAIDCWQYNVRVNAISPGVIRTPALESVLRQRNVTIEDLETYPHQDSIMNRLGTPENIAGVALFLATEDAAFMTGSNVVVDGGKLAL